MIADLAPGLSDGWWWLIVAVLLCTAEMVVPGVFLIWIGLAALLTGVLTLVLPLPMAVQFGIFAIASVASIYAGRRFLVANPMLNDRGARLVGTIVTAVEPVDALQGRVRCGDSVWSARGASAAAGDRLRIVAVDGSVLVVEAV